MFKLLFVNPLFLVVSSVAFVAGCASYTINQNPTVAVPITHFYQAGTANLEDQQEVNSEWWLSFNRESLNCLIQQALSDNLNVVEVVARFKQSQALLQQTRSALFPQISFEAEASKNWQSRQSQSSLSSLGAELSWEVDLSNRFGAATQAEEFRALARAYDIHALKLLLSAEVANTYFSAVAAQNRLVLLNQQVQTDQQLLDLLTLRFESGVGTKVEVLQQKSRIQDSFSLIPMAESDYQIFENRLDVLLGIPPDGKNRITEQETLDFSNQLPSLGVPAQLLLQRPDLLSARAELIAADAEIAQAIAERLPSISLSASFVNTRTRNYVGPLSMLMADFVQPLLDWGQRKAVIAENKAIYEEQLARFTGLYLQAVEEVENALVQEQKQRELIKRLITRKTLLLETFAETEVLYTQGVNDYLPVLSALQELRALERDLVNQQLNLVALRIQLIRAIGGNLNLNEYTSELLN